MRPTYDVRMRVGYAHQAAADLAPGGDERALGGAITLELCGRWDCGPGECRTPHHTAVVGRFGDNVRIRVVFACEPDDEPAVRERITAALSAAGSGWTLRTEGAVPVAPAEAALAGRLVDN